MYRFAMNDDVLYGGVELFSKESSLGSSGRPSSIGRDAEEASCMWNAVVYIMYISLLFTTR